MGTLETQTQGAFSKCRHATALLAGACHNGNPTHCAGACPNRILHAPAVWKALRSAGAPPRCWPPSTPTAVQAAWQRAATAAAQTIGLRGLLGAANAAAQRTALAATAARTMSLLGPGVRTTSLTLGSLERWRWVASGFEGQQVKVCLVSLGQQQGRRRVACWRLGTPPRWRWVERWGAGTEEWITDLHVRCHRRRAADRERMLCRRALAGP